jgi:AhpD family alkylhydroperoxidase
LRIDYQTVFPDAIHPLEDLERHVRASGVERKLLELVEMRASQLNGCRHCADGHAHNAAVMGEDDDRLVQVSRWRDSDCFNPRERAALHWSEMLTLLPMGDDDVDVDTAFAELSEQFEPREIVAVTGAVLSANSWNRLHLGLGEPSGMVEYVPPDPSLSDPLVRKLAIELGRLEAELARVREAYRRAVEGPPGPRWYESGSIHPELDDQVIVPPG